MLYPSELQPLIKRLLQIYYNAPFARSSGRSKNFSPILPSVFMSGSVKTAFMSQGNAPALGSNTA